MPADQPLWRPSEQRVRSSQMWAFLVRCAEKHGFGRSWDALYQWSITSRGDFWSELLDFAQIQPSAPARAACEGEGMRGTRWFPGMKLNYARHLLRFEGAEPAILFERDRGERGMLSRDDLRQHAARCAAALGRDGVQAGDRVAGFVPNAPEAVIAMLGAASRGAIWSSCSPDFGLAGVLDRFTQIEPTVLFAPDGYTYGGKGIDTLERVKSIAQELPSLRRVVLIPYLREQSDAEWRRLAAEAFGERGATWRDYLALDEPAPELTFEEVAFGRPLYIMFSSGTTGVPKCIVHGHGGTLLQLTKEHLLHTDVRPGERVFYFTTCGWMMWNWLVTALGAGATIVLYEGHPASPTPHRLWELAAREGVNVFGTSPKFLAAVENAGVRPGREHDLSSLRAVLSTGSPLSAEQFRWVYENVKSDLQLASICGGTDIISCFMLGNPILPVYAGEIQCRGLGMDAQAWGPDCRPVVGRKGELVCCAPFPSQPVGFWNDFDGARYRAAYFDHYPGRDVWRHGDFVEITERGGVIVYGRSDATLNPGGVRIGTAEIYRVVEALPEVTDSIVVGKDTPDGDVEIALFVVLREGVSLDAALEKKLRDEIAEGCTRRHVPRHIRQVSEIPHTISGKKVELAVRQILHGQEVENRDALANPQALEAFRGIL